MHTGYPLLFTIPPLFLVLSPSQVLADRSIYIWGALRGRAFAGIASTSSPSSVKGADGTEEDFKVTLSMVWRRFLACRKALETDVIY
jgi:hypothetical protein